MRPALVALGVAVGVYGGYLLLAQGLDNLVAAVIWLAAGVILHDGVIGPVLVALGVAVVMLVPHRVRAPIAAGLIVLGTVTMTAVPMLGRFGERPDNPTLLDRNYTVGWLVFAVLVLAGTALGVLRALRSAPEEEADVVHEPEEA